MMKLSLHLISQALVFAVLLFPSCKKKDEKPMNECVAVSIDFRNKLDNIEYKQTSFGNDLQAYQNMPKSITVPSGSTLRLNVGSNFDNYEKDRDAKISKVFYKVTFNGKEKECEAKVQDDVPDIYLPAYVNMSIHVRVVLSNNDEASFGPFNVTVSNDNKIFSDENLNQYFSTTDTRYLLASDNDANKNGLYYMFSPYLIEGLAGCIGLYPFDMDAPIRKWYYEYSPLFGTFCLSNRGLAADQIKLVAADKMQANNLYPELFSKMPCGIGEFYARFESWNPPIDTSQSNYFYAYTNTLNLDYSKLDTISITNPQPELVVTKGKPCFKFITSYGKKGYGMVKFSNNTGGRIMFVMQR